MHNEPKSISTHSRLAEIYKFRPPYFKDFFTIAMNKLQITDQSTLLDLCCGRGELSSQFSSLVSYIYAIDGSSEMLKNRIEKPNILYKLNDVNQNSIKLKNKVDAVVVGSAMHWIEQSALKEILSSNLKMSGRVLASLRYLQIEKEIYFKELQELDIRFGKKSKSTKENKLDDFLGRDKMPQIGYIIMEDIKLLNTVTFDLEWFFYNRLSYLYGDFYNEVITDLENYKTQFFKTLLPYTKDGKLKAKLLNRGIIYTPNFS